MIMYGVFQNIYCAHVIAYWVKLKNTVDFKRITLSLANQDIYDVFEQFFDLEKYLDTTQMNIKEWVIVKLVTIIEQFCREVIKRHINKKIYTKLPKEFQVNIDDIERAQQFTIGFLIVSQYNFQNTSIISDTLKIYKINNIFIKNNKQKIHELFKIRHDIVHAMSKQDYDIKKGYVATEILLQQILCQSKTYGLTYYDIIHGLYSGKNGDFDKAMDCFISALKIEPNNIATHYYIGMLYYVNNNTEQAYKNSETIIRLDPKNPYGYYLKGLVYAKKEEHEDAIDCFDQIIQLQPDHIDANNQKCISLLVLGRHKDVLSPGRLVYDADPKYREIVIVITKALVETKAYAESLKFLNDELDVRPNNADAHYGKYIVFRHSGKNDEAEQCFNESTRLNPLGMYPVIPPNDKKEM